MSTRSFVSSFAAVALALCLRPAVAQQAQPYGIDLKNTPIHDLAGPGVRVVVLYFAATDCPISNRYVPEIARLAQEFAAQPSGASPVRFWWVYPNAEDTAPLVEQHRREFSIAAGAILDRRQSLAALAHATVTPEAAVFLVDGRELREVYHGRVDDRYISLGQERPQPQHHDLEEAIAAALAGKPVPQPGGPPVGCSIVSLPK
ncbi:MAG: hypothetical protein P4L26_09960 [Terracidiphilus sp.]|nr:hypothetical protein [Terracidiphilus sp.]